MKAFFTIHLLFSCTVISLQPFYFSTAQNQLQFAIFCILLTLAPCSFISVIHSISIYLSFYSFMTQLKVEDVSFIFWLIKFVLKAQYFFKLIFSNRTFSYLALSLNHLAQYWCCLQVYFYPPFTRIIFLVFIEAFHYHH